jgi:hypothetical protein
MLYPVLHTSRLIPSVYSQQHLQVVSINQCVKDHEWNVAFVYGLGGMVWLIYKSWKLAPACVKWSWAISPIIGSLFHPFMVQMPLWYVYCKYSSLIKLYNLEFSFVLNRTIFDANYIGHVQVSFECCMTLVNICASQNELFCCYLCYNCSC